ncbi:hypothetical protein AB0J28_00415 [Streptosporangium canum]|uniref:hypothetical protein n=1 Tax=Streptosporangium canum TaxID=324952 RepID=UPI003417E8C4
MLDNPTGRPEPAADPEEFRHDTLAHLRNCLAKATALADQYATRGGEERETARQHLAKADRFDELAVEARQTVEEWQELIAVVERRRGLLAPVEGLGLRAAVLGRPPYEDPALTGVHPLPSGVES